MLEKTDALLNELLKNLSDGAEDISPYTQRLLDAMAFGTAYSAAALMEKLGLRSRETFRAHYLNPALQKGLIEMTVPDKPNSRNQQYRKV